jgi:CubicO group peptidase (beta-lactamase class C family)
MRFSRVFAFFGGMLAAICASEMCAQSESRPVEIPREILEKSLEPALEFARQKSSSAVAITYHGRVIVEREWKIENPAPRYQRMTSTTTADGRVREDVASVQKSVTSFLCGVAWGKGLLDIDKPVSGYIGAGWTKATAEQEAKITVRHLMSMSSGLDNRLQYDAPAGTKWMYNTNAYAVLIKVMESAAKQDINELTKEWLTGPIGMPDSRWEPRRWLAGGEDANAIGFVTTARDLARFGLMMMNKGTWDGRDLLKNPEYLEQALAPSQEMNPAYGLLWWLNNERARRRREQIPAAPEDLFMAAGALDRRVYVIPSMNLVVVRLGDQAGEGFDQEFMKLIIGAIQN